MSLIRTTRVGFSGLRSSNSLLVAKFLNISVRQINSCRMYVQIWLVMGTSIWKYQISRTLRLFPTVMTDSWLSMCRIFLSPSLGQRWNKVVSTWCSRELRQQFAVATISGLSAKLLVMSGEALAGYLIRQGMRLMPLMKLLRKYAGSPVMRR